MRPVLVVYRSRVCSIRRPWFYTCRIHNAAGHRQGFATQTEAFNAAVSHCHEHAPWLRPAPPTGRYA